MASATASRRMRRNSSTSFRENLASFWFLLPIIVIFIVLTLVPLAQSFVYSLTDYDGYQSHFNFVGFSNYLQVFRDQQLLSSLGFTLLYSFSVTVIVTVLAIPLAVTLNKAMWGSSFARSLFFFLGVPAQAIIGLVWTYIFSSLDSGVFNTILRFFHLPPVLWLSNDNWARFCVIFVAVWMQVGWHATLYIAYLQTIPADLYEQARVDGASSRQQFFHITLPQLTPGIVISTFLLMTTALKIYDLPKTLTNGGPGYSTNTVTQVIIFRGADQSQYGLGSALSIVFTLASILIIVLQLGLSQFISRRFQ